MTNNFNTITFIAANVMRDHDVLNMHIMDLGIAISKMDIERSLAVRLTAIFLIMRNTNMDLDKSIKTLERVK